MEKIIEEKKKIQDVVGSIIIKDYNYNSEIVSTSVNFTIEDKINSYSLRLMKNQGERVTEIEINLEQGKESLKKLSTEIVETIFSFLNE